MVEQTLSECPDPAALLWLETALENDGGRKAGGNHAIAGNVDAAWQTWRWPDGEELQVWSDNFVALSIRGAADRVDVIMQRFSADFASDQ